MNKLLSLILCIATIATSYGQDVERERPAEWEGIVEGGRFQDRFMPMQGEVLSSEVWGGDQVRPRYIDNGIEDDHFSYWGGNIIEEAGQYHLFACGWLEDSPKGHRTWPRSTIFHMVADAPQGPYRSIEIVGFGHNPDIYRAKNGSYIISAHTSWKPYIYRSKSINGPWSMEPFKCDDRGRGVIEGLTNLSFTEREDGSIVMVCRGGGIWISKDGIAPFQQVTSGSVYPKREGKFEDPEIWRDNVQYHLIVNDWLGRIAYYMRSADGVNWVEDCGEAYTPGIARHEDGSVEDWYKFERIKIFQDKERRAVQANFAVCDTLKLEDMGNDNHSSKNIAIPLNKGVLMEIVDEHITQKMRSITLLVRAEEGFDPQRDIDVESLRFGLSEDVNFGGGCRVKSVEPQGKDLLITFKTSGYAIPDSEFAPKMMGRNKSGGMIYGYARNPNVEFEAAIVTCRAAQQQGADVAVAVENLGLQSSADATIKITTEGHESREIAVTPIKPYGKKEIIIPDFELPEGGEYQIEVVSTESKTRLCDERFTK